MDKTIDIFIPSPGYQPQGAEESAFELLMKRFADHEQHEQEFLGEYQKIVDKNPNPLVKFLLQLIMSDEEKHHNLVQAITSTLRADLTGMTSLAAVPKFGQITAEEKKNLARLTAQFIEQEKSGIKEYKNLIKSSKGYYNGILVLFIQTIIHDSEKHLMILGFIEKKLRES